MIAGTLVWLACAVFAFYWLKRALGRERLRSTHRDSASPRAAAVNARPPQQLPNGRPNGDRTVNLTITDRSPIGRPAFEAGGSFGQADEHEPQIVSPAKDKLTEDRLRELMGLALTTPTPEAILEFSAFASRLRRLGPYNIMMVYSQRPGAQGVGSRNEWAAAGQTVRPDALPILILRPNGPIAQVFELEDTLPPRDRDPRTDAFAAIGEFRPETLHAMIRNLSAPNKRKLKVEVTFASLGSAYAGWVSSQPNLPLELTHSFQGQPGIEALTPGQLRGHWRVMINSRLTPAEQFSTLLHELGHLFCGHAGAFDQGNQQAHEYGWPDRSEIPHPAKEVEAELVAWHICERWGLVTGSAIYLRPYLELAADEIRSIDLDRIIRAIAKIEHFIPRAAPRLKRGG